jgi:hypothetical protein
VAVHRVLVERHEHVDLVTLAEDGLVARSERQEDVAAANDGLVGVVGVHVQAAADEDTGENIAGGGDALARRPANAYRKVDSAHR